MLVLVAGCSTLQPPLTQHLAAGDAGIAACADFLRAFRGRVEEAGVADAQSVPVPGFPYLRGSRFLASFRNELDDTRRPPWLTALREKGRTGERVELANLPDRPAVWRALGVADRAAAAARLDQCGNRLLALDTESPETLQLLQDRVRVPDAYADYQRVFGLYPLTALAARQGISRLYADIHATFQQPPELLPVTGTLVDYIPPGDAEALPDYAALPRDALGRPQLAAGQLQALFRRHAPVWRIDVAAAADLIGMPYRTAGGGIDIDTERPVVFTKASHTRWRQQTLLQLNYIIWLPERPLTGALDLLGGHIDGITWRVTLADDGEPLLYDAMHNCGCYHMAFPSARLRPRQPDSFWQEPLLTPAAAPRPEAGQRIRIRLEQGTHYLQAVEAVAVPATGRKYEYRDYALLRSLPAKADRRRSMFNKRGLVPGSERLERWLLWPMGVPEPGAMRQWGTHATAFVGKRHFDDADLMDRYFVPAP